MGSLSCQLSSQSFLLFDSRFRDLCKFVQENQATPFSTVREILTTARYIASNSARAPRVMWAPDSDQTELLTPFGRVSIRGLAVAVKAMMEEMESLLTTVTFGLSAQLSMSKVKRDDWHSDKAAYSFVKDRENCLLPHHEGTLLDHISGSPELCKKFLLASFMSAGKRRYIWNRAQVDTWRQDVEKIRRLQVVLAHICGGQPPRGTEECTYLLQNREKGTLRGMYAVDGYILLMQTYGKTRGTQGIDKEIFRLLPKRLSDMFLAEIVLVRPFDM